jgi:hypothetical protein
MSIDRIGKRDGPSGISPPTDVAPAGPSTGQPFKVERAAATEAASALDRVRAGEITIDQYLDQKVQGATEHLAGIVSPEQLSFIQNGLREQLATDPVLVDLVRAATGRVPTPRE